MERMVNNTYTNKEEIDMSQFPKGIYVMNIYTEKGVGTKKIIID